MNIWDIVIIVVVGCLLALAIRLTSKKGDKGCGGCSNGCGLCRNDCRCRGKCANCAGRPDAESSGD